MRDRFTHRGYRRSLALGVMADGRNTDVGLMFVAVAAASLSAPIAAGSLVPAIALAFWRCALAAGATGLLIRSWPRESVRPALWAGVLLGVYFALSVPSVRHTSVLASAALVSTQPIFSALLAMRDGARVVAREWIGIALAAFGVVLVSPASGGLLGNALALGGALLMALYLRAGARVRMVLSTGEYTLIAYSAAAGLLLVLALVTRAPIAGYGPREWLLVAAFALGPQLLGHSVQNHLVGRHSPMLIGVAMLLQVPGAALVASLWLGQQVPLLLALAAGLIVLGLGLVQSTRQ